MHIQLKAADGFTLGAFEAKPKGTPKGGVVILQEIFGVNAHMREVCEGYAADGFVAVAPALFDRASPNADVPYTDFAAGGALRNAIPADQTLADVDAAVAHLRPGKVAVIGYCWGGTLAWISAAKLKVDGAVGYYGSQIPANLDKTPHCPVLLHFGETDKSTPPEAIAAIRAAHPKAVVHTYPGACHAFNRAGHPPYNAEAAKLARERTLTFLAKCFG